MKQFDDFENLPMTAEKVICYFNTLRVKVGSTGLCGGDTGHGGRTCFMLENLSSTDMTVKVGDASFDNGKVQICLGGDSELRTFIDALQFTANSLKAMMKE